MKLNKGLIIMGLALGATVTAFAVGAVDTMDAQVTTCDVGETPEIPEDAVMMHQEIIEE